MGKTFGIVVVAIGIWVSVEIYSEGMDGAFGGLFASSSTGAADAPRSAASVPKRAGAEVERAHREHEARYDALLPD